MDGSSKVPNSFAVNDSDAKDSALPAFREIRWNQVFKVLRMKSVKIEFPGNWQFDRRNIVRACVLLVVSHWRVLASVKFCCMYCEPQSIKRIFL